MNKVEAAKLLTLASGFDRFVRADDLTTGAWAVALRDVPYGLAEAAVVAHYCGPDAHKQLMPGDVIKATEHAARLTRSQVEADVRSAKARGLVDASWPYSKVLDEPVRRRLALEREADRVQLELGGADERISPEEFRDMERRERGTAA